LSEISPFPYKQRFKIFLQFLTQTEVQKGFSCSSHRQGLKEISPGPFTDIDSKRFLQFLTQTEVQKDFSSSLHYRQRFKEIFPCPYKQGIKEIFPVPYTDIHSKRFPQLLKTT
jgi:hypothetical protein